MKSLGVLVSTTKRFWCFTDLNPIDFPKCLTTSHVIVQLDSSILIPVRKGVFKPEPPRWGFKVFSFKRHFHNRNALGPLTPPIYSLGTTFKNFDSKIQISLTYLIAGERIPPT